MAFQDRHVTSTAINTICNIRDIYILVLLRHKIQHYNKKIVITVIIEIGDSTFT